MSTRQWEMPKQHPMLQRSSGHFPWTQKHRGMGATPARWRQILSDREGSWDLSWHLLFFLLYPAHTQHGQGTAISYQTLSPLLQLLGMIPPGCWGLSDAASPRRGLSLTLEGCRSITWTEQARAEGPPLPSPHRNSWKPPKIDLLVENSPSPLTSFLSAWQPSRTPSL